MASAETFPILIVEDSDDDLFLFRRVLTKAGITHPLRIATNGQAAIDELGAALQPGNESAVPRLVFLDLKLPLRSGFEVLEWIRSQPALQRLAVLVLSSSAEARDIKRAYDLQANGYLVKYPPPNVFSEIMAAVAAVPPEGSLDNITFPGSAKPV